MSELWIWVAGLAMSVIALVWLAFLNAYGLHTIVAAATALTIAAIALRRAYVARNRGASEAAIARLEAYHMGAIWSWGAVSLTATYLMVLAWKEWWQFALAFGAAAALAFYLAVRLGKEPSGTEKLLGAARWLTRVQLAGMALVVVGLIADRKMDFEWVDWAGNNIFFFGALALGVISLDALKS